MPTSRIARLNSSPHETVEYWERIRGLSTSERAPRFTICCAACLPKAVPPVRVRRSRDSAAAAAATLARVRDPVQGLRPPAAGRALSAAPRSRWLVASVVAPFAYAAPLDGYLHALKYREARHPRPRARVAGRGGSMPGAPASTRSSPVPLHGKRLTRARLQPSREIARTLAREASAAGLLWRGIRRARSGTPPQKRAESRASGAQAW